MANEEKQKSDGHAGANLRPCRTQSFCQRPHQQDCAGGQVTNSRGVQRRNRGYRVANRQVRRAPDDVNREERSENCQTTTRGCTKRQRSCFGSKSGALRFCTHLFFLSLNAKTVFPDSSISSPRSDQARRLTRLRQHHERQNGWPTDSRAFQLEFSWAYCA